MQNVRKSWTVLLADGAFHLKFLPSAGKRYLRLHAVLLRSPYDIMTSFDHKATHHPYKEQLLARHFAVTDTTGRLRRKGTWKYLGPR